MRRRASIWTSCWTSRPGFSSAFHSTAASFLIAPASLTVRPRASGDPEFLRGLSFWPLGPACAGTNGECGVLARVCCHSSRVGKGAVHVQMSLHLDCAAPCPRALGRLHEELRVGTALRCAFGESFALLPRLCPPYGRFDCQIANAMLTPVFGRAPGSARIPLISFPL